MRQLSSEIVQRRIDGVACPICRKQGYRLQIKSQSPDGDAVYIATCLGCRYSFPVDVQNRLYGISNPDIGKEHDAMPCQKCGEPGVDLEFRCARSVRDNLHFLRCRTCGDEYVESAPAEAFE